MTKTKKENSEGKASNLAQLKHDYENIKTQLNELSTDTTKTQGDKETQAKALIQDATSKERALQEEIDKISKDGESTDINKQEAKDAQNYLNTTNSEIQSLYNIICAKQDDSTTQNEKTEKMPALQDNSPSQSNDGNIFIKTWNWIGDQWGDVRDEKKRKEEKGKNILRTVGFLATGVGAVALAYKGVKKLRNRAFGDDEEKGGEEDDEKSKKKKKKEDDEGMSWWKKGLLWAGGIVGTVLGGTAIYKNWPAIRSRFKEKLGDTLTMEQAVISATAEVRSGLIDESPFRYNFDDGIQYDDEKKTIKSYGWETQIDPVGKKLVGLDNVVFKDYKELIHAANITNCLKSNFHNCCSSDTPFDRTTGGGGDLQIGLADGSQPEVLSASDTNAWVRIGGVGGGAVGGLLGAYCGGAGGAVGGAVGGAAGGAVGGAALDNNSSMGHVVDTIKSGVNFEKFRTYLNQQKSANGKSIRPHENENIQTDSPLKNLGKEVLDEIRGIYSDNGDNFNRNMDILPDENDPHRFYVQSYGEKVPLVIDGLTLMSDGKIDYSKIKSIKIGKYKDTDRGEGLDLDFPHTQEGVKESIRVANLTNKIRKDFRNQGGEQHPFGVKIYGYHRHLQIDDRGPRGIDVVYRETLSSKFPTIWQDLKKQINETDQAKLRKQAHDNVDQEGCGSKYIRYLHQMREQRGNLSYWRHEND